MSTGSVRQLWLLPALLITVIATALGALIARDLYDEPETPPPAVVQPTSSAAPPSEQPGSSEIKGTVDAVAHPLYRTLQPLLQEHFNAINDLDYERWTRTVTRARQSQMPRAKFNNDFDTTADGGFVVYRIEALDGDSARVLMEFTSTQDVSDAPKELQVECIHWNVVYAFAKEDGDWKLAGGTTSSTPKHEACEGF